MIRLILILLLAVPGMGQARWRPIASNMQTEYVLRYMDAARIHHWARMRYTARSATAYCEYKYGERMPYGGGVGSEWFNDFTQ